MVELSVLLLLMIVAAVVAVVVKSRLGVTVRPVTIEEGRKYGMEMPEGVAIQWVDPKGPLGKAGFEPGDIILEIDKIPVEGVLQFMDIVGALPHKKKIVIVALDHRTGQQANVVVEVN